MSYWSQNTGASSQLDELLSKEDVTIQEIMDQPEVLQECKSQNKKLIDFLARPDVLRELITFTTQEPVGDNEEAIRYKYSSTACELLTCELSQVIQTIAREQSLLNDLFAFLEADPPLNPLLSSFFSRIMGVLIAKTSEQNWFSYQVSCLQVLEFLKSKENCIDLLVLHIGTSAIMDLILKMYTKLEGPEIRNNFLTWLDNSEFLEKLLGQLNPDSTADVRSNVCQLVCDLIRIYRESKTDKPDEDRIAKKIESEDFVKRLLEQMFLEPRCEGSIVGGISVLLTLLGNGRREEYPFASWDATPNTETSAVAASTVTAIIPHLPHVLDILKNPPQKPVVRTTVGCLDPPLGATRVEVARLIASLVATADDQLLTEIQSHDLLNVLLDLFFQYPWNNFLHAQVEATLIAAFKSSKMVSHIFSQCLLIQRVLKAWKENDAQEKDNKPRRGYMGHLIRIANHIISETDKPTLSASLLNILGAETLTEWQELVTTSLAKVNGDQSSGVGFQQKRQDDTENDEFYQELFRRYQLAQTLTPSFEDNFCVEQMEVDEDIGGEANNQSDLTSKPSVISMESDLVNQQRAELFNQICSQKMQTLDDDAEMWSSVLRSSSDDNDTRQWTDDTSSDEDDWPETGLSSVTQTEQSNPWSADVLSASSPPDPDQGWANFEASPFLANFGFDLSSTIATSAPGDLERVPFDLTPTTSDWPDQEPPVDWPVSPPSETPPSDVETPPADKDEIPPSLPKIGTRPTEATIIPPEPSNTSIKECTQEGNSSVSEGNAAEALVQDILKETMETAQVIDSEKVANIVSVSDLKSQTSEEVVGESSSSLLKLDLSQNSSDDSVIAAFAPATVIKQTDEAPGRPEGESLPSNVPLGDVAEQLAELLADVTVSQSEPSIIKEAGEIVNGPTVQTDDTIDKITGSDYVTSPVSALNNDDIQAFAGDVALVPNDVTTSILAVKEEEGMSAAPTTNSDPVTATAI